MHRTWLVWDCISNSLAGRIKQAGSGPGDWAHVALTWFNHTPRLCATRMQRDGAGQVAVLSPACEELAASEVLEGLQPTTWAYTVSPDDRRLAGLAQGHRVLLVLDAMTCETLLQLDLVQPDSPSFEAFTCTWDPSSTQLAIAALHPDADRDLCLRELAVAYVESSSSCAFGIVPDAGKDHSCVLGWCSQGIICLQHSQPDDLVYLSRGRVAFVQPHRTGLVMRMLTDGVALSRLVHLRGVLRLNEQQSQVSAHVALSPCATWLAVLGGEDHCAWKIQVSGLRAES